MKNTASFLVPRCLSVNNATAHSVLGFSMYNEKKLKPFPTLTQAHTWRKVEGIHPIRNGTGGEKLACAKELHQYDMGLW